MVEKQFYDFIIVGAGILGCATAKYLKEQISQNEKILLIDKYATCGQGNTSKSNACYRNIFDTALNISLCNSSVEYYKSVSKEVNLGLKEVGYLWLLTKEQMDHRSKKNITDDTSKTSHSLLDFLDLQKVKYKVFSQEEVRKIFPTLQLETQIEDLTTTITNGLLGYQCGTLSPDLLVKHYEQQFTEQQGECAYGYEVIDILLKEKGKEFDEDYFSTVWRQNECAGIKVRNVKTNIEEIIQCKKLILCTGAWINQLLYKIGIHIGVNAKKRQLFRIKNKHNFVINKSFTNKFSSIPFIILPEGGVFIKPIPENGSVDAGCSDDVGRRFEQEQELEKNYDPFRNNLDNPKGEMDFYQTNVLPVLKAFFPSEFNEKTRIEGPSAGMYAYSLDKFPIITKEMTNLFLCTGASGSGIMKGDAIARINVANILEKTTCTLFNGTTVTVKDFSLHERNVPQETLIL